MTTDFDGKEFFMLPETLKDSSQLSWQTPWQASAKLDGFRCGVRDGVALSRNLKPIRNQYIQSCLGLKKYNGLDGELIVGAPTPQFEGDAVIGRTSSGVTSVKGEPEFTFWVFDDFGFHAHPFKQRIGRVEDRLEDYGRSYLRHVTHTELFNSVQLEDFELSAVESGFEGVILRHPEGPYKHGRSTPTEGHLWRIKRFIDGEAVITGVREGHYNGNAAGADELGRVKRSTVKAGMSPNGLVGTIVGVDRKTGQLIEMSPGCMTHEERGFYLRRPKALVGKVAKYKAFAYGVKHALRHVTFQALRHPDDMPRTGV